MQHKTDLQKWVHRQLDNVPIVSPKGSGFTEAFTNAYFQVCRDLNVLLAESCPNHEKAFSPSTFGIVLGIGFNTEKLEWFILKEKADLQDCIDGFLAKGHARFKTLKLSAFAQRSDFLQGFQF